MGAKLSEAMRRYGMGVLGLACLLVWGWWWAQCIRHNHLIGAAHTWVPAWQQSLGLAMLR